MDLTFLCCLLQKYLLQRDNKIENFCSFRYSPGESTGQYKRFDRAEVGKGYNINLQANLGGTPSPVRYEQNQKVALAVFIHISWFSGIILNTHMRIHATVAGQIFHHGRFEDNIFKSIQISWFEITRTLVGPYFNSQPLQCRHLLKHVRFSFHWRVKVAVCV